MATAGSVVLDLVMRTGGFETDSKRAEQRMRALEKEAKRVGAAIGAAFVAGATLVVTALKQSIDHMDELSKAAQRAQMPTEQFTQLAYAGSLADVAVEDLTKSMGKLAKAQGDAARGLTEQVAGFKALGIEFKNADGSLRPTYDVFLDFADAFQKHRGSPEIMALGMQVFGRSFQNLIPLLKDGRAGLESAAEEADRLGVTLSTQAGRQAEEFNDNITRLQSAARGLAQAVAAELLPDLVKLSDEFVGAASDGDKMSSAAHEIADGIRDIVSAARELGQALASFTEFGNEVVKFQNQIQALGKLGNLGIRQRLGLSVDAEEFRRALSDVQNPSSSANRSLFDFSNVSVGVRSSGDAASRLDASASSTSLKIRPTGGGGGKSEAQKAAEALERAYQSMNARLTEQIVLFGETSEAARVRYELENGELEALDAAEKQALVTKAEKLDALIEEQRLIDEGKRLIESSLEPFERINQERMEAAKLLAAGAIAQEDYNRAIDGLRTPAEQMLEDMEFEIFLLGKSREEQERLTAARWLGAEAATEQGRAAIAAMEEWQRGKDLLDDQIDAMDGLRGSFQGFFGDLREGESIFDSLERAADRLLDTLLDIAVQNFSDSLFGKPGEAAGGSLGKFSKSGSGSGGSWWESALSALGSFFGGARASGGDVMGSKAYLVGEQGPELFIPRTAGMVLSHDQTTRAMTGGGPGRPINITVPVQGQVDYRSRQQIARDTARTLRQSQRND